MTSVNLLGEATYTLFAPDGAPWSPWVKPVLFANPAPLEPIATVPPPEPDASFAPPPADGALFVVDLPGARSVLAGLALARRGYRPVPLFNGAPGLKPHVPTRGIVDALLATGPMIAALGLPIDAPPAFLLDADRRRIPAESGPGTFDNRWLTFPQDFPSANLLLARGLKSCVLWSPDGRVPGPDLAHVLRRWQEAGLPISMLADGAGAPPAPYDVPRPSAFRSLWYVALALLGAGRADVGGFGTRIPLVQPSSGRVGFYG